MDVDHKEAFGPPEFLIQPVAANRRNFKENKLALATLLLIPVGLVEFTPRRVGTVLSPAENPTGGHIVPANLRTHTGRAAIETTRNVCLRH